MLALLKYNCNINMFLLYLWFHPDYAKMERSDSTIEKTLGLDLPSCKGHEV